MVAVGITDNGTNPSEIVVVEVFTNMLDFVAR